ncbi:hypothetical protein BN946_scf184977.g52 [Trametes cinnabarina]|uniref:DUF7726 domain-containing protein n=1 Tax=Pycnoporus cinnabarinus TaxID=5643 RepID=A0A060SDD6_PYCCI|nr:hypothetical protein BN946_scf184977.g52 [Trametes cinnabarina]
MPPKRKAEVLEPVLNLAVTPEAASKVGSQPHDAVVVAAKTNITKKPRSSIAGGDFAPGAEEAHSSIAGEGSAAGAKRVKASKHADKPWQSWRDVVLEGEEEAKADQPSSDDCNDIRRKIRRLEKQPGFKITHWLKEIGGIYHNSYQRFMRATGPTGGAENGTYYAA